MTSEMGFDITAVLRHSRRAHYLSRAEGSSDTWDCRLNTASFAQRQSPDGDRGAFGHPAVLGSEPAFLRQRRLVGQPRGGKRLDCRPLYRTHLRRDPANSYHHGDELCDTIYSWDCRRNTASFAQRQSHDGDRGAFGNPTVLGSEPAFRRQRRLVGQPRGGKHLDCRPLCRAYQHGIAPAPKRSQTTAYQTDRQRR